MDVKPVMPLDSHSPLNAENPWTAMQNEVNCSVEMVGNAEGGASATFEDTGEAIAICAVLPGAGVLTVSVPKQVTDSPSSVVAEKPYEPIFDELLARSPALRRRWEQHTPERELALAFNGMRRKAGLTQKQVAEAAGWDPGYVSRLESGRGPMPEPSTVQRYAAACGGTSGYVLIDKDGMPTIAGAQQQSSP